MQAAQQAGEDEDGQQDADGHRREAEDVGAAHRLRRRRRHQQFVQLARGHQVDEVIMGCVLPAGLGQAPARQAARGAGIPDAAGCTPINKGLIHPLFQASAKQYAKEKGITPRDCSKEK